MLIFFINPTAHDELLSFAFLGHVQVVGKNVNMY